MFHTRNPCTLQLFYSALMMQKQLQSEFNCWIKLGLKLSCTHELPAISARASVPCAAFQHHFQPRSGKGPWGAWEVPPVPPWQCCEMAQALSPPPWRAAVCAQQHRALGKLLQCSPSSHTAGGWNGEAPPGHWGCPCPWGQHPGNDPSRVTSPNSALRTGKTKVLIFSCLFQRFLLC